MRSMVEHVHQLWKDKEVEVAIDFTMGNGYDTISLCKIAKQVYSFDIQKEAIIETKKKVQTYSNVHLIQENHIHFDTYVTTFDIGVFNLGYLPKGNHETTTKAITTLPAIQKALNLLRPGGTVYIVVYRGHTEGQKESEEILPYVTSLSSKEYHVAMFCMLNKQASPYVIEIEKAKSYKTISSFTKEN